MVQLTLALLWSWSDPAIDAVVRRRRRRGDGGQTTAEYALVLLGAASVALLLVAWAAKSGKVGALLDGVVDSVLAKL